MLTGMPSNASLDWLSNTSLGALEGALARLSRRPRGAGVALPGIVAHWPAGRHLAGLAIPVTLSTDEGFPHGKIENADWWRHVEAQPGPKVVVAQVLSAAPGTGAACGVLSAHVLKALGCSGFLTDGYVRDVDQMAALGFLGASRGATVRHGVPHVVRFGEPVDVFGMKVAPGDFVLAGSEGALAFPAGWVDDLPAKLREVEARVNPVLAFCRGGRRSATEIQQAIARYMPAPAPEKR
jgi:regulator of RNase E activity RraA